LPRTDLLMSNTVKCTVCGKLYNAKYVSSHMRRSHAEIPRDPEPGKAEPKIAGQIVALFNRLSPETRKQVLDRRARENEDS
jgi:hypothetical protein